MGQFAIRTDVVTQLAERERKLALELVSIKWNLSGTLTEMTQSGVISSSVRNKIKNTLDDVSECGNSMNKMASTLEECATEYQQTEKRLMLLKLQQTWMENGISNTIANIVNTTMSLVQGDSGTFDKYAEYLHTLIPADIKEFLEDGLIDSPIANIFAGVVGATSQIKDSTSEVSEDEEVNTQELSTKSHSMEELITIFSSSMLPVFGLESLICGAIGVGEKNLHQENYNTKLYEYKPEKGGYEYKDGKWTEKHENAGVENEEKGDKAFLQNMTIIGDNYSETEYLFGCVPYVIADDGELLDTSLVIEPCKYEYYGNWKVGPGGVSAEVGRSFTGLSIMGFNQFGNDMLGLHLNGGVEIAKAEISGGGKFTWLDEDGKFDPAAKLEAGAQFSLVEAGVTGGVDILGTDIDLSGSIEIGVGAHAEIGYDDGKFVFDVGIAAGLGVNVAFEVDISETVDAVVDFASDTINAVGDFVEDTGEFFENVGDFFGGFLDW